LFHTLFLHPVFVSETIQGIFLEEIFHLILGNHLKCESNQLLVKFAVRRWIIKISKYKMEAEMDIDIEKSAGPSTVVLVTLEEENMEMPKKSAKKPFQVIGGFYDELIAKCKV